MLVLNLKFESTNFQTEILGRKHKEAIRILRQNENLMIFKPDKEMGTVLFDKMDYINKMCNILDDTSEFQTLFHIRSRGWS